MPDTKLFSKSGFVYTAVFCLCCIYIQGLELTGQSTIPDDNGNPFGFASVFFIWFVGTSIVCVSILPGGFEKDQWLKKQEILGNA